MDGRVKETHICVRKELMGGNGVLYDKQEALIHCCWDRNKTSGRLNTLSLVSAALNEGFHPEENHPSSRAVCTSHGGRPGVSMGIGAPTFLVAEADSTQTASICQDALEGKSIPSLPES